MSGRLALADVAARILHAPARAGATRVVAIDGPAGSGKTTLAVRLAAALSAHPDIHRGAGSGTPDVEVVHMDDIYPGWDGLAAAPARLAEWILEPLAAARPARYRRYDWVADQYVDWVDVGPAPVLVIEGCASGSRTSGPYLSHLLWVSAPERTRMARGIARDGEAFRPHWERWARQEAELFAAEHTADRADLRIDGAPTAPHDPDCEVVLI